MAEFEDNANSVTFWLRVKPGSSRERLRFTSAGELSLEVSAPPAEGRANEACVRFLASALRMPLSSVVIKAGQKSRRKLIRITSPRASQTLEVLENMAKMSS